MLYGISDDGRKELLYDGKSIGKKHCRYWFDPATRTVYVPTFLEEYGDGI
ncbi:MAG: hypothetical protein IPF93_06345 [Saprospiraceae bacterium]|nr:hypothetical protein [Saprospiraceae bacterium]